jgi:hypothetical protein
MAYYTVSVNVQLQFQRLTAFPNSELSRTQDWLGSRRVRGWCCGQRGSRSLHVVNRCREVRGGRRLRRRIAMTNSRHLLSLYLLEHDTDILNRTPRSRFSLIRLLTSIQFGRICFASGPSFARTVLCPTQCLRIYPLASLCTPLPALVSSWRVAMA